MKPYFDPLLGRIRTKDKIPSASGGTTIIQGGGGTNSPLTTKGDLWGYDTADARIPVGADDEFLGGDSSNPLGVSYRKQTYFQFVYNSSGSQEGNRYNNFEDLNAAIAQVDGQWSVQIEQNEEIDYNGTVDWTNGTILGNGTSYSAGGLFMQFTGEITIDFSGSLVFSDGIGLRNHHMTNTPLFVDTGEQIQCTNGAGWVGTNGTVYAPLIEVTADSGVGVISLQDGQIQLDGDSNSTIKVSGICALSISGQCVLAPDQFIGDGILGYVYATVTSALSAQSTFGGFQTTFLDFTNSAELSYDNSTSGLSASNVKDALDELASEKADKTTASGSFTTVDLKTITVVDGVITDIS